MEPPAKPTASSAKPTPSKPSQPAKPAQPDELDVLAGFAELEKPGEMMTRYLLDQIAQAEKKWLQKYEARKTPEQIAAYQEYLKKEFLRRIGGLPTERTPLNAKVVGQQKRRGYRLEKIIFESQPRHFVTAVLFLPDPERFKPPWPGVVLACGHSNEAKAYPAYAAASALMALNGIACLVFDPIDQGERHQWRDPDGKFTLWGTAGHTMIGKGSILLGRNTARFEIWDAMRAVDYLQSRPDVDPKRIGATGISGGGTQTAYLMALDSRIVAAAPGCYLCSLYGRLLKTNGPQDAEQNIFGQLALGMDHADYCMMRAPLPTLILAATQDYFNIEDAWMSYRMAKRLYARLGYPERMELAETDEKHGFSVQLREAAVRWMLRWLAGREEALFEPKDLDVPTKQDLQCTPEGEVMLLEGARSVYDLNRDYARQLAEHRRKLWAETPRPELLERIRQIAGIGRLADLPPPQVIERGVVQRDGYRVEKLLFRPEKGIYLPALLFVPAGNGPRAAVVYIHEDGKQADASPGGPIETMVRTGKMVLAVDLRGTGQTQSGIQRYFSKDLHGPDGQDFFLAYLLGRSYVGMRTEDILLCARWLQNRLPTPQVGEEPSKSSEKERAKAVELVAVGHVSICALHAAALEPELFCAVKLVRPLVSWTSGVELGYNKIRLVNLVHGALEVYDLPDLAGLVKQHLGEGFVVEDCRDAMDRPIQK
ncbi:MAG: acetylxylan esterase [Thermoguttaceae bacterium]|nr:acetylxylan esterase [Thermoguttaceae bacterium]